MIKILFIHQSSELYGSDKTLLLLISNLDRDKFFPVILLPSKGPLSEELEKLNVEVIIAPVLKVYRNIFTIKNIWKFIKEIRKSMHILNQVHKKHNFDLIYSNTLAVMLGAMFSHRKKIPHIWHVHEIITNPKIIANFYAFLLKRFADIIICNSYATRDNLAKRIPSLDKKIKIIHNGIEINRASEESNIHLREELGFAENDIVVSLIGRINRLKGHKWLLNTYSKYLKDKNIKLLFVGSTVCGQEIYLTEINELVKNLNIEESVKIIDFRANLASIWATSDIITVPSTEAESFGMIALEAMLAKKPVIGSNLGGLIEIIEPEKTGFLINCLNESELAQAILKLSNSAQLRNDMGNNGYRRAIENFGIDSHVKQFEKIFYENTRKSNL